MTILVDGSLLCNLNCKYCYNKYLRQQAVKEEIIDIEAIKRSMRYLVEDLKCSREITMHGGEPTFWDREMLEELLSYSYKLTGKSSVQTNGTLIDDELIEMFKKYKTSVGVSIDGPGKLNRFRCNEALTRKIIDNIYSLKRNGISTGIIIVVHKANGLPPEREILKDFVKEMSSIGITGRMNLCLYPESDGVQLSVQEAKEFYLDMAKFLEDEGIWGWSPFKDMINSLLGRRDVVCIFNGCDPYASNGGIAITSTGKLTPCHKFYTEELEYTFPQTSLRDYILQNTDCKGCRYFPYCHGGCPANARDGDWRNKTQWCPVWKTLWEYFEKRLRFMGFKPVEKSCKRTDQTRNRPHGDHWERI